MRLTPDGLAALIVDHTLRVLAGPKIGGRFASSRRASRTWKRDRCKNGRACMSPGCSSSEASSRHAQRLLWVATRKRRPRPARRAAIGA